MADGVIIAHIAYAAAMHTPDMGDAKQAARRVQGSGPYRFLVRGGLVAFGVVHLLIALIAGRLALGDGGGEASQAGALRELAGGPFGTATLGAAAVGFFVISIWQLITAATGHRNFDGMKRTGKRLSSALRTILYAFLGVQSARIAFFGGGGGGGETEQSLTATLLRMPFGVALVAAVGVAVLGYGGYQIYKGAMDKYNEDLEGSLSGSAKWFARAGHIAKGVAFAVVGGLFVAAAFTYDPEAAGGLDAALRTLQEAPFGQVLLVVVALGLAAYGVYCFFWARRAKFE